MAKSWADLSKEERDATGMTKKEYNQSTGYRAEVIANEQAAPPASSSTNNRVEAKETAQAVQNPNLFPDGTPRPTSSSSSSTSNNSSNSSSNSSSNNNNNNNTSAASNNSSNNRSTSTSNNSSTTSAQQAVGRTKTWAEMSKAERQATGMTKKEYNRQGPTNESNTQAVIEADRTAAQNNPTSTTPGLEFPTLQTQSPSKQESPQPVSSSNNSSTTSGQQALEKTKTWAEMSKAERNATGMTKKEYNRQDQKSGMTANYNVDNLSDFDLAGGGAGAHLGEQRLSFKDLQGLDATGNFTREELVQYADDVTKTFDDNEKGFGDKADKLVQSWRDGLISGGGEDTIPGGGDTVPGGGDTVPGGGDGPPDSGDFLDDYVRDVIDNGGNVNVQDVSINQGNEQDQSIIQDNDINSEVIGDYNNTTINQDNTATNTGGNQGNSAGVSNTNESAAQDLVNDYVTNINTNPGINNGSGGNLNAQVADVEQENTQNQTIEQDNDIDSRIEGDFNTTEINQNNSASNIGGEQTNSSTVTNSAEGQAQDLLGGYIEGINTAQSDSSSNPSEEVDSAIVPEDSGPDYSTLAGQDLTNPATFLNFQEVQSQSDNTQSQSADQNNDINSQITGNNNFTQISQDNSVRNYGGDQRNFTYVSNNNNPYTDTPASAATMAGFYDVSDSPASSAAFVDQYSTLNRDNQKYYDNVGQANEMIYRANSVSPIDTNALEDSLYQSSELARARGQIGLVNVFGDMQNFPQFSWNSATRQSGISSPDFGELAEEISDGF